MIILEALERGLLTGGPPWKGKVVSVYRRALNIRRPDGLLVSLVAERRQMSALSVHVPRFFEPGRFDPGRFSPSRAPGAAWDGARLTTQGRAVTLKGVPWYDSTLRLSPGSGFPAPLRSALRRALIERGRPGGLLSVIDPGGEENAFARAAQKFLRQAATGGPLLKGLNRLVGLGIGFTPSGDDFLAGLLMGEALTGAEARPRPDRMEIAAALTKTSDGGRSLLAQILEGHFPHYLIETAAALAAARDAAAVDEAVARAVRYGETSGTDTLTGLLWYLETAGGGPA